MDVSANQQKMVADESKQRELRLSCEILDDLAERFDGESCSACHIGSLKYCVLRITANCFSMKNREAVFYVIGNFDELPLTQKAPRVGYVLGAGECGCACNCASMRECAKAHSLYTEKHYI